MANPFYAGYYPGSPVARRPKRGGKARSYSPEWDPTLNQEFFDTLEKNVYGVPGWLIEQELEEIKGALKASYKADTDITPTDLVGQGEEEAAELPGGVNISVNLNPLDWIKDPLKEFNSLTVGSFKKAANVADFDQRAKKEFWGKVIERKDSPFYLGDGEIDKITENAAGNISAVSATPKQPKFKYSSDPSEGPRVVYAETNPYVEVSTQVGSYLSGSMAAPIRNAKMVSFSKATLDALNSEIKGKLYSENFDITTRKVVSVDETLLNTLGNEVYETAAKFDARVSAINSVDRIAGKKGLVAKLTDDLDRGFFGGPNSVSDVDAKLVGLAKGISASRNQIAKVKGLSKEDAKAIASVERSLNALSGVVDKYVTTDASGNFVAKGNLSGAQAKALKREVSIASNGFYNGFYKSTFDAGSLGRYVNHVLRTDIISTTSELQKNVLGVKINVTTPTGSLQERHLISGAGRRVGNLARYANNDYEWQAARDLVEDLQEGKLPTQFLWKQVIRPRIETFTPSYLIDRTLSRGHYFGLRINDGVLNNEVNGGVMGSIGNGLIKSKTFGWVFDNNVTLTVDGVGASGRTLWKQKITIKGDKSFGDLLNGSNLFNVDGLGKISDTSKFIVDGLNGRLMDLSGNQVSTDDFLALLNWRGGGGSRLATEFGLSVDNANALIAFRRDFLKRYGTKLGLTFDRLGRIDPANPENLTILKGFFVSLHNNEKDGADYFSIADSKVGVLDRYAKFISRVQSKTVTKIARLIWNPTVVAREKILEKVNAAIANGIVAVFGDATAGLGYLISWAIKFVVQWVLTKFEKIFKKFWQAARYLDYGAMGEMFEAAYVQTGKWAVYVIVIGMIPVLFVIKMTNILVTTLPTFDPSLIGQIQPGGGNLGLGFGDASEVNCSSAKKSLTEYKFMSEASSQNSVTSSAYALMDEMMQGFWCFWNQSPSYNDSGEPDLFNEYLFSVNPNPGDISNCWNCLFWCTYLAIYSGADISTQARADKMEAFYMNGGGHYVSIADAYVRGNGDTNIRPGDIIFIHSAGRSSIGRVTDSNHVGVVYAVTPDMVITLHSNSGEKAWAYGVDEDGKVMDNQFHIIQGFGGANN